MKKEKSYFSIEPQKPNAILYWLLAPIAKFVAWAFFRIKIDKDKRIKKIKGAFVAIGTHSCPMDVSFMMTALLPRHLNIVCGRDVFTWRLVKPILKYAGLLPISQFATDIGSIRYIKKAVDNGCSLAFFPEGKISLDGRPLHYLSPSLTKLLKFLNVPVVMCHNNGGYSSRPKWYKSFKRGRVEQTIKLLFTQEELSALSNDEMYARLKEEFDYNDHIYQRDNNIRFRSKSPAKGLNYILYKCPKCEAEYEMVSTDRELLCEACGNKVEYTEYGELIPSEGSKAFPRIDIWYDYQRESIRKELANPNFRISKSVVWEQNDPEDNIYKEKGEGELYIDDEYIGFAGKMFDGTPLEIKLPLKCTFTIVQKTKEAVDLTVEGVINRFYFRDARYSVKYTLLVEESFRKINNI
ncbi:MAG: 1-acyl-sn-glycerol-3-phosphate acyltransferase [Clostridia bacterium]